MSIIYIFFTILSIYIIINTIAVKSRCQTDVNYTSMASAVDSEARIQSLCVQWYTNTYCLVHHSPRCMIFHVPNQNQHHLISTGVLPGVSDLIVLHRTRADMPCVLLWVEVKTPTGTQSPAQRLFEARVTALGYSYHIVRSLQEFKDLLALIT